MFESKYSKVLTILLIVVIIAIVGLLIFFGYDYYQKFFVTKEASKFVENYEQNVSNEQNINNEEGNTQENSASNLIINGLDETPSTGEGSVTGTKKKYNGYTVAGTISIPVINVNYPILEEKSTGALQSGIVLLYPTSESLNQPGNVVLIGHNYRNGLFFSNVKKLEKGNKIYIIDDVTKVRKEYTVYNKFEASENDASFYQRDTNGIAEITLSTCTDASNDQRTIVFAKATN